MSEPWKDYAPKESVAPWEEYKNAPAAVKAGSWINRATRDVLRSPGLAARYGLEGLAQVAQIGTEPIRYVQDLVTPERKDAPKSLPLGMIASNLADSLGLPKPENANERVVGDATRLVAGAGGLAGTARAASALPGMTGKAMEYLATNIPQQLTSAAGAGLAGGASREAGGGALSQGVASLFGGVGGGMLPGAVNGAVNTARNLLAPKLTPQQLDIQLTAVLSKAGGDYSQLPAHAKNVLRNELRDSLQANKEVDPEAVRRLADFATVRGATPTRGMVTQDPVQITREMNLAKTGANSSDGQLQGMARIQNQNNRVLIEGLNEQGALRGSVDQAGDTVTSTILGRKSRLRAAEDAAWDAAKTSPGYRQPIEAKVISDINQVLGDDALMPFMDTKISKYMESFLDGTQPFTPQAYRNLQSMLSNEMKKGGNEGAAAGAARRVLESSDLRPITNPGGIDFGMAPVTSATASRLRSLDAQPGQAIDAVNQARAATRAAYAYEKSSPLVRSVLSDGASADPARIAKRFVIGGTPQEAQTLAKEVGEAGRGPIRDALVAHLKEMALGKASDEVGKFSQSAYNKALMNIGDRKLQAFFSPEEIAQLKAVGRVASYMQSQPVGSAVNNSNSGALLLGRGLDALTKIPMAGPALQNINVSMQQRAAQNIAPSLLVQKPGQPMAAPLLLPALALSGGLLSP